MAKIVPRLSDFRVFPLSLRSDDDLYLILFQNVQGNWCLDQWPSGCPNRMQPLYHHPTPVSRLDLSRRFWLEVKYHLPPWGVCLPGGRHVTAVFLAGVLAFLAVRALRESS